jgi:ABC-type multidrug transport system permease subunit
VTLSVLRGIAAALEKDLRLLARDRVGLVFLTIAPIVVIAVAGLSLATLYGAAPRGGSAPVLPLVDEDGGWVGRAVRDGLRDEPTVRLRDVASADAARALVVAKAAAGALVVPAGTSDAIARGEAPRLDLLLDPVRTVDVATLRGVVQEVRHRLEVGAIARAQDELDRARTDAEDARRAVERAAGELRRRLDETASRIAAEQRRRAVEAERALDASVAAVERARRAEASARLASLLGPLRAFLTDLDARRAAFAEWFAGVKKEAGRFADRVPPPPEPPAVPPTLAELAHADADALVARVLATDGKAPALPRPPRLAPPALPPLELPALPAVPRVRLPGALEIAERSVTGAPLRFNTFDQNVPGFGVTFLLLGVLLGVSLGLLDERDWGTLERVRATGTPLAALLVAKLVARAGVGVVQMALLFAVGWLAFGMSPGPEPAALALPTLGIVYAGTAFGLVVAGVTRSREAVLPIGSIAILTMAAVGGCWWPIDLEPEWMRRVALAFPTTWAMEAYNDLMIRRRTAAAVLPATGVLVAYGTAYLALGLAVFRRAARRDAR